MGILLLDKPKRRQAMSELKKCPNPTYTHQKDSFLLGSRIIVEVEGGLARVVCLECGCSTGWWETEQEAIEAWNRRADSVDISKGRYAYYTDRDGEHKVFITELSGNSAQVMFSDGDLLEIPTSSLMPKATPTQSGTVDIVEAGFDKIKERSAWLRLQWTPKKDYTPEMASHTLILELLDTIDLLTSVKTLASLEKRGRESHE